MQLDNTNGNRLSDEIERLDEHWGDLSETEKADRLKGIADLLSIAPSNGAASIPAARRLPTASIIIAARNYGRFLGDCLRSCLSQTVRPLEVIYSDDASQDDSLQVARSFEAVNVLASPRHGGAVTARNRGARSARGDVLIFLDGDDQLPADYVEKKLAALTRKHSFAYGDVQAFGGGTWQTKNPAWKSRAELWQRNICETSAAVWADLFWQAGGWREAPGNCWDWDLWLRLSQIADPVHSGSTLLYRVHPGQDSQTLGFGGPGKKIEEIRSALHRQALQGPAANAAAKALSPPQRPLRVGFIYRTFCLGGAEQWLLDLLKAGSSRADLAWSGVAITSPAMADDGRVKEASQYAMLVSSRKARQPEIGKLRSVDDAISLVAAESDALVCWSQDLPEAPLKDFAGPIVLLSHSSIPWERETIERQQSRATHFAAVSRAAAAPFSGVDVSILHNGIDLDRIRPTKGRDAARRSMRKKWGLAQNEIAIGYVGRQSWEKNPLAISQAAAALGKPFRAVYVGDGWKECEVQYISRQICQDAIFAGPVHPVGDALAALDCVVLASPQEGMSLAVIEAWAAGVPVVGTRVGAVPELEEEFGPLLVPAAVNPTPKDLAKAVKLAVGKQNAGRVEHAKQVARQHFTAEAMAERWAEYLLSIR